MKVSTKFKVDTIIRRLVIKVFLLIRYVTLWPWPLTFWPWSLVIHGRWRDQPLHQVWRSYGYPFLSYEFWHLPYDTIVHWQCICSHCACAVSRDLIFATKACIDNRKKLVKQQYLLHMSPQYGELRPTSGCDRSGRLGHTCKFQRVSRLCTVTARHSSRVVGVSQTLRRWTKSTTYIRQGDHHVGHWPTFYFCLDYELRRLVRKVQLLPCGPFMALNEFRLLNF